MDPNDLIYIMLLVFLVPVGFVAMLALWALRPWLRATAAGTGLTIFEVIGMKLRRVDVDAVIVAMVIAEHGEVEIHQVDLQRAYLNGANLQTVTQAYVAAKHKQLDVTFEQVVDLDREGRLGEVSGDHVK
jgi:uncharacterized protein YqfA (UPF0365 family)